MKKSFSKVLCTILAVAMCFGLFTVFANASSVTFTDVPRGTWFYDAVMSCADQGYVSGVGNNKFMPNGKLTYAQIFTMFTNAFYKAEKQDYENNRWMQMDAYFDGNPQWWSYNAYYFMDNGLLEGTSVNLKSNASANSPITRYEVVQIANNILKNKGITVSDAQRRNAQNTIADWNSIPTKYRDAVASCFSLKIISGYPGNRFVGTDTLTRAQACVILNSLVDVVAEGGNGSGNGNSNSNSVKDVEVTTMTSKWGTGYYVKDNGFGTGKLNNGKAITEANVLEMLEQARKIWPAGGRFGEPNTYNNQWYEWSGPVVDKYISDAYGTSSNYGCGGFASMLSDYVFGQNGNPMRQVSESELRPGDIMIRFKGGVVDHVSFVITSDGNGAIQTADGGQNTGIGWNDGSYDTPKKPSDNAAIWNYLHPDRPMTFVFLSRYPA